MQHHIQWLTYGHQYLIYGSRYTDVTTGFCMHILHVWNIPTFVRCISWTGHCNHIYLWGKVQKLISVVKDYWNTWKLIKLLPIHIKFQCNMQIACQKTCATVLPTGIVKYERNKCIFHVQFIFFLQKGEREKSTLSKVVVILTFNLKVEWWCRKTRRDLTTRPLQLS